MVALPERMRVVEMTGAGGPEVLRPGERPVPRPGDGEVLIRVAGAGVNGPDLMQRRGLYPPPPGASDLLGLEVAGEVVACGAAVQRWTPGDVVCALTNGGGYAEYVAVQAGHCLPLPPGIGAEEGASLPEAYFTVWSNIFMGAGLRAGETLLVHGGAGGLGTAAIQLGRAFGARVAATDTPAARLELCRELGAERAIDYASEDFVEVLRSEFGGADVVLDIVGGPNIQRNLKVARHDGRIVQLAFGRGSKVEVDLMPVMLKRLRYMGSTLRSRSDEFKSRVARELEERVWPLFAQRQLRATVSDRFALADAGDAHRLMERGGHAGKIVLKP
jgi:putative PIG3 family NAD(P)H quinone oxidoreductase